MKIFSDDLVNLLASGAPIERAELFKIGPCRNGAYIYATNYGLPFSYAGHVYDPVAYGAWSRGDIEAKIGLESSPVDLSVIADGDQTPVYFPGTTDTLLIDGIKFGLLGAAAVSIFCVYWSEFLPGYAFPTLTGPSNEPLVEIKFVGLCGEISLAGVTKATVTAQDMLYLLNLQVPQRVFQATCSHVLFDAGCRLVEATFTKTGAVASVTYPQQFVTSAHIAPTSPAGTFAQGVLTWTSGNNNGLASTVRTWTAGGGSDTIVLDIAPIFPVTAGDTFSISQGCNQTFTSCLDLQGSVNAYINYGGQPDVPVPETAIG